MDENPSFFLIREISIFRRIFVKFQVQYGSPKPDCFALQLECRDFKSHGIANIVRIKQEFLEFSLYKSSRVVPRVTLAPFLESQVQNLKKRFFASFAMFSGEKLVACSEFFFFSFFIRF